MDCALVSRNSMPNNFPTKIDGALGAMIIEDQPTHSIYSLNIANYGKIVNATKFKVS